MSKENKWKEEEKNNKHESEKEVIQVSEKQENQKPALQKQKESECKSERKKVHPNNEATTNLSSHSHHITYVKNVIWIHLQIFSSLLSVIRYLCILPQ